MIPQDNLRDPSATEFDSLPLSLAQHWRLKRDRQEAGRARPHPKLK
jgi:hypothetical protein